MKNILLATDFSANAQIAAIYAAELAYRLKGRLIIFHALSFSPEMLEEENVDKKKSPEGLAQQKLDIIAQEIHSRFGISVSRLIKPGTPETEIPAMAQHLKAELIVVGTQGAKQELGFVGTVAATLLRKNDFAVVCVPPAALLNFTQQLALMVEKEQNLCNTTGLGFLSNLRLDS
ncbi:universal stress protein [Nafulsella turpanensis]|uniref:universal stress protein n=1 Tax=Nafulsella turpanensis TaxID=1265690 RepID=UPI00034CE51D|nr:universal stress protein [Nafulsella turpanensis]